MSPNDESEAARGALDLLGKNPAFRGVTASHLADIGKHGRTCHFNAGVELMHQGAVSDCVHIVVRGRVRVERTNGQLEILAELAPGDVVGEIGVLTGEPRSATVIAKGDVETLELAADELLHIFQEDHMLLLSFITVMHDRLHQPGS